jgi:hypothetical protein
MSFQHYQRAFAARIRDPKANPRPEGVPARGMKVYEELLWNNLEGFLLNCFPVCRKTLGKRRWERLARTFFREHVSRTPYFRQIPEEFLCFLQDEWQRPDDYPEFLPELAHYEWVELELDTSNKSVDPSSLDAGGDLLDGRPLLNPVSRLLAYRWPVQRLSPRYRPSEPPAVGTFILAFRDPDHEVRFNVINPATARLLGLLLGEAGLSGRGALACLAGELGQADRERFVAFGATLLDDLREQGAILGTRR